MGAGTGIWGTGPFDSDGAGDLLARVRSGAFTFAGLDPTFEDDEYVTTEAGRTALVLVELALAVHGLPHAEVPDEEATVAAFAEQLTPERTRWLVEQAERTLGHPDTSQLYEQWTEPGAEQWRRSAQDSVARLRGALDA